MNLLVVTLLALVAPAGADLSPQEMEKLDKGDVVVRSETFTNSKGKDVGRGIGAILIDRSVADVWATLSRYEDRPEYIPRLKKLEILEKKPGLLRVKQTVDASITTAIFTAWFTLDAEKHQIRWKLDDTAKDNTIAEVDGEYHAFELSPTRTLLYYRTYVDSGRSVPRFISDYMSKKSIPDLLRNIKKRVESGGTWKK